MKKMKKTVLVILAVMMLCTGCATTASRTWYPDGQMATESSSTTVVGTIDSAVASVVAIPIVLFTALEVGLNWHCYRPRRWPCYYTTYGH